MSSSCGTNYVNGKQVVDKLRMMGYSEGALPIPHVVKCRCKTEFEMEYFEDKCPSCGMVFGILPCHSHDPLEVKSAGIKY